MIAAANRSSSNPRISRRPAAAIFALLVVSLCNAAYVTAAADGTLSHCDNCQCFERSMREQLHADTGALTRKLGCCDVAAAAAALQVPVPRPCAHLQVSMMRT